MLLEDSRCVRLTMRYEGAGPCMRIDAEDRPSARWLMDHWDDVMAILKVFKDCRLIEEPTSEARFPPTMVWPSLAAAHLQHALIVQFQGEFSVRAL